MKNVVGVSKPKEMIIEAVIIRADGSREELGAISYWHRNPFKRIWHSMKHYFSQNNYQFIRKEFK